MCLVSMRCYQALLRFPGEEVETRSAVVDGYVAWISSVLVRTLSILAAQKLEEERKNQQATSVSMFFLLSPD